MTHVAPRDEQWARAVSALAAADEVCLACHVRPDGDALGSMLAVGHAVSALGRARVIASFGDRPFAVPDTLRFLPGLDLLSPPDAVPERPRLMITFDVASVDRLGLLAGPARRAGTLIVLDHHESNPGFGTINLIDPSAAATAVLAARLIDMLGVPLTVPIASGLYTGLVTDTGSFRFSTTPQVHLLAARLIEAGVDPDVFARQLLDRAPFGFLRVLSAALGRAVLEPAQAGGHGLVWTTVTRQDRAAAGEMPYEVAESVIDLVRRTEEAEVAVVFKEADDGCWHVSVRSKGLVDVARACVALGGGGHSRAAGFSTCGTVPDVLARLRALLTANSTDLAGPGPAGHPGPVADGHPGPVADGHPGPVADERQAPVSAAAARGTPGGGLDRGAPGGGLDRGAPGGGLDRGAPDRGGLDRGARDAGR